MTQVTPLPGRRELHFAIAHAVAVHGARRVLFAVLRELLRPPPRAPQRPSDLALGNHMRRDIGLPPKATSPPHWTRHL